MRWALSITRSPANAPDLGGNLALGEQRRHGHHRHRSAEPHRRSRSWTRRATPASRPPTASPRTPSRPSRAPLRSRPSSLLLVDGIVLDTSGAVYNGDWSSSGGDEPDQRAHAFTATAVDVAGNASAASTPSSVTVETVAPTVTVNQAADQIDPAATGPVLFTRPVQRSRVYVFTSSDPNRGGTAHPGASTVSGGPASYSVSVTGMTSAGTVTLTLGASKATDAAGLQHRPDQHRQHRDLPALGASPLSRRSPTTTRLAIQATALDLFLRQATTSRPSSRSPPGSASPGRPSSTTSTTRRSCCSASSSRPSWPSRGPGTVPGADSSCEELQAEVLRALLTASLAHRGGRGSDVAVR